MKVITLCVGELAENCYIIPTENNNAVIIDPGFDFEEIMYSLKQNGLTLKKILLTHGHFDHIMAVKELVDKTSAEVYIHKLDEPCLTDTYVNLYNGFPNEAPFNKILTANLVQDNDKISQDNLNFIVLHTPGHSLGSCCYLCEEEKVMFCGDTVFRGSVGSTSFPFCNHDDLVKSLSKIKNLSGDYKMYCGHGPATTLEDEKNHNIYFSGIDQIN